MVRFWRTKGCLKPKNISTKSLSILIERQVISALSGLKLLEGRISIDGVLHNSETNVFVIKISDAKFNMSSRNGVNTHIRKAFDAVGLNINYFIVWE